MASASVSASAADTDRGGWAGPLCPAIFAAAMARLGPFEPAPRLAVAVSGGPDSMALALLADDWARARGGTVLALTVDHALRPEAAIEAAMVGRWLGAIRIEHRTLRHQGTKPASRIQETARHIRYELLVAACRAEGILHLLLAHHRDDQAETVALRLAAGSGDGGLAGMAGQRETAGPRLLRPLLDVPRDQLAATVRARGQPSITDPSNADRRYQRVRLRQDGVDADELLARAGKAAAARVEAEHALAAAAAELVWVAPEGYALLDGAGMARLPSNVGLALLANLLRMIGSAGPYGPRGEAVARLADASRGWSRGMPGATLAGCRILPWRGRILVCREPAAIGPDVQATGGGIVRWDSRFTIAVPPGVPISCRVSPLGIARPDSGAIAGVPGPARPTLPALWSGDRLLAVPTAGWSRAGHAPGDAVFRPRRALAGGPFAVV